MIDNNFFNFLAPESLTMLSNKPDEALSGKICSCCSETKGHRGPINREDV